MGWLVTRDKTEKRQLRTYKNREVEENLNRLDADNGKIKLFLVIIKMKVVTVINIWRLFFRTYRMTWDCNLNIILTFI